MRKLSVALLVAGLAMLLTPVAVAAAVPDRQAQLAAGPVAQSWLRLSLQTMDPRIVSASDTSVTVAGTITNISDRWIRGLTAGLQLDDALTDGTAVRTRLSPSANYSHSDTTFSAVTAGLAPGASAHFSVSEQLQGPHSLQVTQPGVYPLRVNVQGVPDYGKTARLALGSLLLPVLAAPGGQQPHASTPAALTVLWPLVDAQPRVLGVDDNHALLSDDSLAASLSSGGRLFGLLDAVNQVAAGNPTLLSGLCFAIDPDLLDTVNYMAAGYQVRGKGGTTVPGRGSTAAAEWLTVLKSLTAGHCVLALPYADADLASLTHAGGTNLLSLSLAKAAGVARSLGATPMANVAWPADGVLDTRTMTALAGQHVNTVLLNPTSVTPATAGSPVAVAGFTGGDAPKVVPIDPMVAGAMAVRTDEPNVTEQGISAQDGLAAVVYRTVFDHSAGGAVLVAPPRRWSPSAGEAVQFLQAAATVLGGHYANPTPLSVAAAAAPTGRAGTLNYPPSATTAEVAHQVAVSSVEADLRQRDLQNAMGRDVTNPNAVLPSQLIDPLQLALLRAVSTAWRDGHVSGADGALTAADDQLTDLTQDVTVGQPNLPISLGSKNSTVPVTVNNRLPVDIKVRVDLTAEPGLPSTGGSNVVPAGASITMFIKTNVTRSGRFSVYATARTPGGTELGQQARFELVSNAYGTIILIVTVIAFGLLVLLSGRRIFRRMRAARLAATPATTDQETVGALVGAGDHAGEGHSEHREPDEH
jgi:Family of unknown function (DUF6049)